MMTFGKAWGWTRPLLQTPFVEAHFITVEAGGFCSMHKHDHKFNTFILVSGRLDIEVRKAAYKLVDCTKLLKVGDTTTVQPGEFHRFRAGNAGAQAIELYSLNPIAEDIIREDVGGVA